MRKWLQAVLVGAVMAVAAVGAQAITVSYAVDAGIGFGVPNTIFSGSGNSFLDVVPVSGVLELPTDFDVVTYTLTTIVPANGAGDTIAVNNTYTIRFILGDYVALGLDPSTGFAGAAETLDFQQQVQFTINNIKIGSATNVPGAPLTQFIGPTSGSLGGNVISIGYLSLDFPGAPVEVLPGTGVSTGALTDQVASVVPEPSAIGLLAASLVPLTMFRLRKSRRA